VYKVEDMEFGRCVAVGKKVELPGTDGKVPRAWINAVWDESGAFVLYPNIVGHTGGCRCLFVICYDHWVSAAGSEHSDEPRRAPLG